jgi:hypothetical protein
MPTTRTPLLLAAATPAQAALYQQVYTGTVTYANFSVAGLVSGSAAVPEPASWALMIGGFGIAGGALRRRRFGRLATA